MRIEMAGPPAVGKSTLVRTLRERGAKEGVRGDPEKIPKVWRPFAKLILESYKGTSHETTRVPIKSLEGLAAAWVGDNSEDILVYDELVVLNGFSMAIRYPDKAPAYFAQAPLPALLVNLYADIEVLLKRTHKRDSRRGRNDHSGKTIRCVEAHNRFMPLLEQRGCRIMHFDTGKVNPKEIADEVLKRAKKIRRK